VRNWEPFFRLESDEEEEEEVAVPDVPEENASARN
jgi:hypothetical protein